VTRLIGDLASPTFKVRDAAAKELSETDDRARPSFEKAARDHTSAEVRRRLKLLLEALAEKHWHPTGERLRALRAQEVLDRIVQ